MFILTLGEMAERSKAHAWKACKRVSVSRVRQNALHFRQAQKRAPEG